MCAHGSARSVGQATDGCLSPRRDSLVAELHEVYTFIQNRWRAWCNVTKKEETDILAGISGSGKRPEGTKIPLIILAGRGFVTDWSRTLAEAVGATTW